MSSKVVDSKIFRPHLYSLLHLASVQVAIPLCRDMGFQFTVGKCSRDVNIGFSQQILENLSEMICPEGQEYILSIPQHLRKTVLGAAIGLNSAAEHWCYNLFREDNNNLYWRSDGRVDGHKTACYMVHDINIDLTVRFYLACQYCLEDSVTALWAELEESGQADMIKRSIFSMERFWLKRLRTGSRICWRKSIRKFFKRLNSTPISARFSTFFSSLRPKEREKFLFHLNPFDVDDYVTCLYALTEKEEKEKLKEDPLQVLLLCYLNRPFQSFFLVTVNKMWKYIDEIDFHQLLNYFFTSMPGEDHDFYLLFESFWNCSPANLRESVRKIPSISEKIDSFFSDLRKKRKTEYEIRNSKKIKIDEA